MNYIEVDYGDRICKYSFSKLYFHTGCSYSKAYIPLSEMCPWIFLYHELRNFIFMLITLS